MMTEPSETFQSLDDGSAPTLGNFFSPVLVPCSLVIEMHMLDLD